MRYWQTFEWKPKTKARPQFVKGTGRTYTEPATVKAETALAEQYKGPLFTGPVFTTIEFSNDQVFWSVEDCDDYLNRKLTGDTDNYVKLVSDALNGIAYVDDKQIVRLLASKL